MKLAGRALVIAQDDVDTDVLYPGSYLNIEDPTLMSAHLFEGLDPTLRDRLGLGTILVVGSNFGTGSSREHVPLGMRASGVSCLVGRSFARIFRRNCLNLGLPLVDCAEAVERATSGSLIEVDLDAGMATVDGHACAFPPIPAFMRSMVTAGGLVPWLRGERSAR